MKTVNDRLVRQNLEFATPGEISPLFILEPGARFVISITANAMTGRVVLEHLRRGNAVSEIWQGEETGNTLFEADPESSENHPLRYRLRASSDFGGAATVMVHECPDDVNVILGSTEDQDVDVARDITWAFLGNHGADQPVYFPYSARRAYQEHVFVVQGIASAGAYNETFKVHGRNVEPPAIGTVRFTVLPANLGIGGSSNYSNLTVPFGASFLVRHNASRVHWQIVTTSGDVVFNV